MQKFQLRPPPPALKYYTTCKINKCWVEGGPSLFPARGRGGVAVLVGNLAGKKNLQVQKWGSFGALRWMACSCLWLVCTWRRVSPLVWLTRRAGKEDDLSWCRRRKCAVSFHWAFTRRFCRAPSARSPRGRCEASLISLRLVAVF